MNQSSNLDVTDSVKLARHYFALSNNRQLEEIRALFTPSSTYSSENTGVVLGVDRIMAMQAAFFASFDTLHWQIHHVEEVQPGVVLFDFTFSGERLDGTRVERPGLEYVIVFQGQLQHVEVRNKNT